MIDYTGHGSRPVHSASSEKTDCKVHRTSVQGVVMSMLCRVAVIAVLVVAGWSGAANACCCTCENSATCFPVCTEAIPDAAACQQACGGAMCGAAIPCPDPSAGSGCSPGEVSCIGEAPAAVPAPTASLSGLLIAAVVLVGVGAVRLGRRRSPTR
jgi:hypothetical protein